MTSELLQLQKPFTGERQWIRSCKPAIGNLTILSPNSISRTFLVKTKKKAPIIWDPSLQLSRSCLLPANSREENGGGALLREPPRRGVSEFSDTIERVLQPFKVTIINSFYFFTCCYFPAFLVTRSIFFPIILRM